MPIQFTSLFPCLLPITVLLSTNAGIAVADSNTNTLSGTLHTWPPSPSEYSLPVDDTYYSVSPALSGGATASAPVSVPANNAGGGTYKVQRGETVYAVMRTTGVPVKTIIAANGLQAPYHLRAGQTLKLSSTGSTSDSHVTSEPYVHGDGTSHIVRPGETLYEVMRLTGVPVKKIISLNNLNTPYTIKVGQSLRLN